MYIYKSQSYFNPEPTVFRNPSYIQEPIHLNQTNAEYNLTTPEQPQHQNNSSMSISEDWNKF